MAHDQHDTRSTPAPPPGPNGYPAYAQQPGYPTPPPGPSGYPGQPGQPGYPAYAQQAGYPGYPQQAGYPGQPGYPVQQGYPGQAGYPAYAQQPGYRMPPPAPQGPRSSGRRVAAGVLTFPLILINGLGALTIFTGGSVPTSGVVIAVMALWLLLSLGVLAAGVVILIQHRSHGTGAPRLLMGATAGLIVVGMIAALLRDAAGPVLFSLFFGIPILILLFTRMRYEAAERTASGK